MQGSTASPIPVRDPLPHPSQQGIHSLPPIPRPFPLRLPAPIPMQPRRSQPISTGQLSAAANQNEGPYLRGGRAVAGRRRPARLPRQPPAPRDRPGSAGIPAGTARPGSPAGRDGPGRSLSTPGRAPPGPALPRPVTCSGGTRPSRATIARRSATVPSSGTASPTRTKRQRSHCSTSVTFRALGTRRGHGRDMAQRRRGCPWRHGSSRWTQLLGLSPVPRAAATAHGHYGHHITPRYSNWSCHPAAGGM